MRERLSESKTTVVKRLPSKKKNAAPQPIGKGKAGTGKRMLYNEGAGKKALKTWRSMSQSYRNVVKKAAMDSGYSLKSYMRGHRSVTRKFKLPITKGK